jgi:SAM-dependent methyltransferase
VDWGIGRYEALAQGLLPAAAAVLDAAGVAGGDRVLDVGCGTGNAALLAAQRGAVTTGVDPAERLLEVARADAAARGLAMTFARGEAGALPMSDGGADAVVSVFGVIFAPDAPSAAAEMARVCDPHGRIALAAWIPRGGMFEVARIRRRALAPPAGTAAGAPPFPWHEPDALAGLFAPHGFSVQLSEHALPFTAASAEEFLETEVDGPMWVAASDALGDRLAAVRDQALAALRDANEDRQAFRVTSPYVIATLSRAPA